MKRLVFALLLPLLYPDNNTAQNLVLNGSMEDLIGCPTGLVQLDSARYWKRPFNGSPDLFAGCSPSAGLRPPSVGFGFQYPRTGQNYIGGAYAVFPSWPQPWAMIKEYPRVELSQPLDSNVLYNVRAFISNAGRIFSNYNSIATDSFGFLFLPFDTINHSLGENFNYQQPQVHDTSGFYIDTLNWIEIGGSFIAQGGEKYLIPGDFKRYDLLQNYYIWHQAVGGPEGSLYYFLDDVAVWRADTIPPVADAGADTTICRGGKVKLGTHSHNDYFYEWWPSVTLNSDSGGVVWASPDTTTTYYLRATDGIYTKTMDSVTVYVNNCGQNDTLVCVELSFVMGSSNNPLWHYQWTPSTWLSSDTVGMPLCTPLSSQTYQLLITTIMGDTIALDTTRMRVGSCFYAQAGLDRLICKGDSVQIGAFHQPFLNYVWWPSYMISDTTIGNPVVWPDTLTWYYLQLTDTIGNVSLDSVRINVHICIGMEELMKQSRWFKVYPNPATHQLSFEFDTLPEKDVEITFYSVFGQRVMHRKLSGSTKYTLDISSLNAGLYFYSVVSDGKMCISDKFVKQ